MSEVGQSVVFFSLSCCATQTHSVLYASNVGLLCTVVSLGGEGLQSYF